VGCGRRFSSDGELASAAAAPATAWCLPGGMGRAAAGSPTHGRASHASGCCGPVRPVGLAAGGHPSVTHSRFTALPHRALSVGIDRRRRHAMLSRLTRKTVEAAQAAARDTHSSGIAAEYEFVVLTQARRRDALRIDRNEGGRTSDRRRSGRRMRTQWIRARCRPKRIRGRVKRVVGQSHPGAARAPSPSDALAERPAAVMVRSPTPGVWRNP
jgi:hypothetical protein